jgi:peroxiredoxin
MKLEERLAEIRARVAAALGPADQQILDQAIERLCMMQIAEGSLALGDLLPDFTLPGIDGKRIASGTLLARGPLVLTFFRGGWCPFCDAMLQALEAARPQIEALGGTIVAVSPDRPELLAEAAAEKGLGYTLLSDIGACLARLCGVSYEMDDAHAGLYARFGRDLPALHAGSGWELPISATYVVKGDGSIAYAFANPDWAKRADPEALIAAVRRLAQAAEPMTSEERRGLSASSTKTRTGGE